MRNLFKETNHKSGKQRTALITICVAILFIISIGVFFWIKSTTNDPSNSDALKGQEETVDKNIQNNVDDNGKDKEQKEDKNTQIDNSNQTEQNDNKQNDNVVNAPITNNQVFQNNNNNIQMEEQYFQKFQEQVIVNKEWETLDVSWKPLEITGALIPAKDQITKPVIKIEKSSSINGQVTTADALVYTITAENVGNGEAKNVVITDKIDTKYFEVTEISNQGVMDEENVITWNVGNMKPNEAVTLTVNVKVKEVSDEEVIDFDKIYVMNKAYATGENIKETETQEVKNEYVKPIISGKKESFVIREGKKVDARSVLQGDVITYKITLKNKGTLSKVLKIEDILPDSLEDIKIVSENVNAKIENNQIIWNVEVPARTETEEGEITLEYVAKVKMDAKGTVKNSVVSSDKTDIPDTKNPIIIARKTSVVAGKEEKKEVTTGDIIEYRIKVENTSEEVDAKEVKITDAVPEGTKLVEKSISDHGTIDNGNITWTLDVEKGKERIVTFRVEVLKNELKDSAGKNTVIANIAYVEGTPTNEDKKEYQRPNFKVEKEANKKSVKVGEEITYTVKVTNNGTCEGTERIIDKIPVEDVELIVDSIKVTKGENKYEEPNLNWDVTLGVEETATITYTVRVKAGAKEIENSVVTLEDKDITKTPVVEIIKTGTTSVRLNGEIEYTITVRNTSSIDLENATICDELEERIDYVEETANPSEKVVYDGKTISWEEQTIKAGEEKEYKFTVKVNGKAKIGDKIENTAKINETPSNKVITKVEDYQVTARKSVDKEYAKAGDTLKYTITLENSGNIVGKAEIIDKVPEGTTLKEGTIRVENGGAEYKVINEEGRIRVENIEVNPGKIGAVVTFEVTVNENVEKAIKNKAEIKVDDKDEPTNETATSVISKTVTDELGNDINNQDVHKSQVLVYHIKINNKDNKESKIFKVYDRIQSGFNFVERSATDNGVYNEATRTLNWENIIVEPNSEKVVSFKVVVSDNFVNLATISNTANVNGIDTNAVKNRYVMPILKTNKVSIVNGNENGTNAIKVGDKITYQINVINNGSYKAENVKVEDTIPNGTKLISGTLSQIIDVIEVGETKTLEFTVEVIEKGIEIRNVAKVNDEDTNETKNPHLTSKKFSEVELTSKILTHDAGFLNTVTTGTILKYSIEVENTTDENAKNVVITDIVPNGTILYAPENDRIHKISDNGTIDEKNQITWIVDVNANSKKVVSFYVIVTENRNNTTIKNEAYVNDDKTETTDNYVKPEISGIKSSYVVRDGKLVEANAVLAGDVITYQIKIKNTGSLGKYVTIVDTLPDQLENIILLNYQEEAKIEKNKITWNVLIPKATDNTPSVITLEYTATIKEGIIGTVVNGATIDDVPVTPKKNPIITARKTSGVTGKEEKKEVTTGDIIEYRIKVENTSEEVDAKEVKITDAVPEGTKLVEGSISDHGTIDNGNITWTLDVEKGKERIVTFRVEVLKNELKDSTGKNTVIANIAYVEGTPTNEDKKEYQRPNFKVEKEANKKSVKVGEEITYTVKVTNSGTCEGTERIIDKIPVEDVELIVDSIKVTKGKNKYEEPNLNWDVTLGVEETATITYTVRVKAGAKEIENSVVTLEDKDITKTPVVEITKTGATSVRLNGEIEYTITVRNTSSIDLENATIYDELEERIDYVEETANPSEKVVYDGKAISWEEQTIKAGEEKEYKFTVKVNEKAKIGDKIENTAKINETSSNKVITKIEDYQVTARKSVDKEYAKAGDTLKYTITLENSGNIVGKAEITDKVPEGTTLKEGTIRVENGGAEYKVTNENGRIRVENIEVNPEKIGATVTFEVTVNENVEKAIKNKAEIRVDDKDEPTNETATSVISKTVTDEQGKDINSQDVVAGKILVYHITVDNTENKEEKTVTIKDSIPEGTTFISAIENGKIQKDPSGKDQVIWNNMTVAANSIKTVSFKVSVKDIHDKDKIRNVATVNDVETNEVVNNYIETVISLEDAKSSRPEVQIDGKVVRGTNIVYTITVKNEGGLAKSSVIIKDIIPDGTAFVSADEEYTKAIIDVRENENTVPKEELTWIVDVPAYGSVSKKFIVKVEEKTELDSIKNTATIDGEKTNTTEDEIYYEDKAIKFSKKSDTIIGKNIVMALDISNSMNQAVSPKVVDKNDPCTGPEPFSDTCGSGAYYEHQYVNGRWYHYKTRLTVAKETMIKFLNKFYQNPVNQSLTVDIVTFENTASSMTVNINNYVELINKIDTPSRYQSSTRGATNVYDALVQTKTLIKGYTNDYPNMVIFLGDGEPSRGTYQSAEDLGNYADTIYNKNVNDTIIYSVGFGVAENTTAADVLNAIDTNGNANLSQNTTDLENAFDEINVKSSYLYDMKVSEKGMIKNYEPISDAESVLMNEVDGTKDIIVKYNSMEYKFSATGTKTSIQTLNETSETVLKDLGVVILYLEEEKKFNVNFRNTTVQSTLENPTLEIIYY